MKCETLQTLKELEDGILEVRNLIAKHMIQDQDLIDLIDTKLHILEMMAANMRVRINVNGGLNAQ